MSELEKRFQKVLETIDRSLDGPLDVPALAGVAAYSKFHFQRQFSAFFGLGVAEYRRLLKLKRAGQQLAFRGNCRSLRLPTMRATKISRASHVRSNEILGKARRLSDQRPTGLSGTEPMTHC